MADSKQTLLSSYLSGVLLAGLLLNNLLGWSRADPIAALVIAVWAPKEGPDAWKGDTCCANPLGHTYYGDNGPATSDKSSCSCC